MKTIATILYYAGAICLSLLIILAPLNRKKAELDKPCVGHCPPPGPMDCTIYGRKKDGSWPSGFECSSTP